MLKNDNKEEIFDIAIIGGGPAGMMASCRASELEKRVVLIEKNKYLGKKLLLTGKGRCNLTQLEFNNRKFVQSFGNNKDFLFSPLSVFGIQDTINFFEISGLKTKVERGKRVFPESDKSRDVLSALIKEMRKGKVKIFLNSKVVSLRKNDNKISEIVLDDKTRIVAKKYIIATGGMSYQETGCTGDGYKWAKKLGHNVVKLRPSLVPLKVKEEWIKQVKGLSLRNIRITILNNKKRERTQVGEMLFTHFGLSGPIILSLSKKIGDILENQRTALCKKQGVKISLDLKPGLDFERLDKRVQIDFKKYSNRLFRNSLNDLLPQKFIPVIVKLSGINPNKKTNNVTKQERHNLVKLLKSIEMNITGLLGFSRAIITSGGISLKEIDSKTMKSKIIDNLYFAGEVIDLDGPSGGYNLQVCWTTGYVSGQSASQSLE